MRNWNILWFKKVGNDLKDESMWKGHRGQIEVTHNGHIWNIRARKYEVIMDYMQYSP